jgi:hypothetical protein
MEEAEASINLAPGSETVGQAQKVASDGKGPGADEGMPKKGSEAPTLTAPPTLEKTAELPAQSNASEASSSKTMEPAPIVRPESEMTFASFPAQAKEVKPKHLNEK